MPFESKAQQRYLFSQKPDIAKEFAKKTKDFKSLPEHADTSGLDLDELPGKLHIADHFIKKEWLPEKGRFRYIYPGDENKEGRKIAKESMTASDKGDIPKRMKLSNPVDKQFSVKQKDEIKGGKADNKKDSDFKKETLKAGSKVEMEHTNSPKLAKEIAKDHLVESPNYYKELKKMEKRLETQDLFSTEVINGSLINNNILTNSSAKTETADGAVGRTWKWKSHEYSERVGPKGEYKYEYKGQISPSEEKARRDILERNEKIQNQKDTGRQHKMGNFETQRQEKQVPNSNPQNTDQYLRDKPRQGNSMAEQAKNAGNVIGQAPDSMQSPNGRNSGAQAPIKSPAIPGNFKGPFAPPTQQNNIGQEDYAKQDDPSQNPLHPARLTPEQRNRFGQCHALAQQRAAQTGGTRYTTAGRAAGFHSITQDPDGTIYDGVLGIAGMPADQYFNLVPYTFVPNP